MINEIIFLLDVLISKYHNSCAKIKYDVIKDLNSLKELIKLMEVKNVN